MPTLLSLGPPTRDRELWRRDESVVNSFSNLTWSGARSRKLGANYEPVSGVEELTLRSKRDRDVNVVQTLRDVENLCKFLERNAESAVPGDNEAQKRRSETEADVEARKWEQRSSEVALYETHRELKERERERGRGLICVENWK